VAGTGLFELELRYFQNEKSIDYNERCCSGKADALGRCIGTCKTRFRVCLKQYQATIDTTSPCTFGDAITPVLEGTTLNFTAIKGTTEGFANPLRFPFEFVWPVSRIFGFFFLWGRIFYKKTRKKCFIENEYYIRIETVSLHPSISRIVFMLKIWELCSQSSRSKKCDSRRVNRDKKCKTIPVCFYVEQKH
uniref:Notch ligand N-terminal domain-containing protein n=1 Tax=Anopheles maculatus TaxID=74869 RepID=A0A182SLA5_9DIPT